MDKHIVAINASRGDACSSATCTNRTFLAHTESILAEADQSGSLPATVDRSDARKAKKAWEKLMETLEEDDDCPWKGYKPGNMSWINDHR